MRRRRLGVREPSRTAMDRPARLHLRRRRRAISKTSWVCARPNRRRFGGELRPGANGIREGLAPASTHTHGGRFPDLARSTRLDQAEVCDVGTRRKATFSTVIIGTLCSPCGYRRPMPDRIVTYISCRGCETVYSAIQERGSVPLNSTGSFDCIHCGKLVHHWAGIYSFHHWKVAASPSKGDGKTG